MSSFLSTSLSASCGWTANCSWGSCSYLSGTFIAVNSCALGHKKKKLIYLHSAHPLLLWGKITWDPFYIPQTNWGGSVQGQLEAHCDLVRDRKKFLKSNLLIPIVCNPICWSRCEEGSGDCQLLVSPLTQSPIRGEVNLLRYLARCSIQYNFGYFILPATRVKCNSLDILENPVLVFQALSNCSILWRLQCSRWAPRQCPQV